MKKYISVAFTLKGQDFNDILPALEYIAKENPDATLVHGFMTRDVLSEKGLPTDVVDALDRLFPEQINFYKPEGVDRIAMRNLVYENSGTAYIIGKVKDGVKEEMLLYVKGNVKVKTFDIGEADTLSLPEGERHYTKDEVLSFGKYLLSDDRTRAVLGLKPDEPVPAIDQAFVTISDSDWAIFEKSLIKE